MSRKKKKSAEEKEKIVRQRYYGRHFTNKEELMDMIHTYIEYYNNCRVQRNLGILTPMEKHRQFLIAA